MLLYPLAQLGSIFPYNLTLTEIDMFMWQVINEHYNKLIKKEFCKVAEEEGEKCIPA